MYITEENIATTNRARNRARYCDDLRTRLCIVLESCLIIIFLFVLQDIDTLTYVYSSFLDGRVSVDDL